MRSIVILDFGGQYAHLIARRVREAGAYSEIREAGTKATGLKDAAGIILSGGPASVYDNNAPKGDPAILGLGVPVLGICYGLHWMTEVLGGNVKAGNVKEYGKAVVKIMDQRPATRDQRQLVGHWSLVAGHKSILFKGCPDSFVVWMSHGDEAVKLPDGFENIATSDSCKNAGFADDERRLFALQFHPEVVHTEYGNRILKNFVDMCDAEPWSVESYERLISEEIKRQAGGRKVFMLVSGGVDSTVTFALLEKVLGKNRVFGLLIDTGLMRKGEVKNTRKALKKIGFDNLHIEDASQKFFENLEGVYDPEKKREIIGRTFIEVQREVFRTSDFACLPDRQGRRMSDDEWMLGQGTIYPDTIETGGTKHADKIKTHHNRVAEIQKMIEEGRVIEPLKNFYKDEVRRLGEILGLPHDLVWRHPFPGPGLGVRILCLDGSESGIPALSAGRPALPAGRRNPESGIGNCPDSRLPLPDSECRILPVKSVGVQGDSRTYRNALAVFSGVPCEVSEKLWEQATDIPNKSPGVNRVLKCVSHPSPVEFAMMPGCVTRARADLLREADQIVYEEMHSASLYEKIWQFPVVLLPFGASAGSQSIVLRPVESIDAMTANAARLPERVLRKMIERILKLNGIDMVFYDLTSKPPATIEWE